MCMLVGHVSFKIGSDEQRVLLCLVNDRLVGLGQVLFSGPKAYCAGG